MKVCVVAPSLNPNGGGVERFCAFLRASLTGSGHVVEIITPDKAVGSFARRLGLGGLIRSWSLRGRLRDQKPDVVITNGSMGFVGFGKWKKVHVYHGTLVSHSVKDRQGRQLRDWLLAGVIGGGLCELASGLASTRVAVSRSAADEVRRYYRFRHVQVIHNGVSVVEIPETNRVGILFVGRRESRKGYETAVSVAIRVGATLTVAGPGEDSRTNNLGVLTERELETVYERSKLMLFPTQYEACSFAILESLAHGCPVVTSRVGWVEELLQAVPSYEALIVDPDDTDAIVRVVDLVLKNDLQCAAATLKATDWVRKNNSIKVFGERWTQLLASFE